MQTPIYFDLESVGLPPERILHLMPEFQAPEHYKKPEAIAKYIQEQKDKWLNRAALSPVTGEVLCIGFLREDRFFCLGDNMPEKEILTHFWRMFDDHLVPFVGFNIKGFDLRFLVKRSWALKVNIPYHVRDGRYWSHRFIDLLEMWQLGEYKESISLDGLAKFLGVGQKLGDGSNFANLWAASKGAALDYLKNDLVITKAIHQRMSVHEVEQGHDQVAVPPIRSEVADREFAKQNQAMSASEDQNKYGREYKGWKEIREFERRHPRLKAGDNQGELYEQ